MGQLRDTDNEGEGGILDEGDELVYKGGVEYAALVDTKVDVQYTAEVSGWKGFQMQFTQKSSGMKQSG
jgi:hypothetical protein